MVITNEGGIATHRLASNYDAAGECLLENELRFVPNTHCEFPCLLPPTAASTPRRKSTNESVG